MIRIGVFVRDQVGFGLWKGKLIWAVDHEGLPDVTREYDRRGSDEFLRTVRATGTESMRNCTYLERLRIPVLHFLNGRHGAEIVG
jgi:hypothetical protein